ncbi:hypothetical protein HN854_05345 [Candidatus Peregrinibacteria bacterium]|jgi:hypothetical protein|nr:hypothetical protein [Candidatus Peregrinibacteria bacterium]
MKHTNLHFRHSEISNKENRLCAEVGSGSESIHNIAETIESVEYLKENPDLMEALEIYDNPIVIRRYEEILSSASEERPYLITLLLDGIIDESATSAGSDGAIDYREVGRDQINPADPFNIIGRFEALDQTEKEQAIGELLNASIPENILKEIGDITDNAELGRAYIRMVEQAETSWEAGNSINSNSFLIDVSLSYYQHMQAQVADQMDTLGARRPNLTVDYSFNIASHIVESHEDRVEQGISEATDFSRLNAEPSSVEANTLSREEYLLYMKRSLEGDASINTNDVPGLKEDLQPRMQGRGRRIRNVDARTTEIFTDLSLEKFGPTVTLDRFGIVLGPQLSERYIAAQRSQVDMQVSGASQWLLNPALAHEFLRANLPTSFGSSNVAFIDSLEWHFVYNDEQRANMLPDPLMSEEDVRAALTLVVQSLLNVEGVMTETVSQRTDLQNEVSFGQSVEGFMRDSVDYIKDFQSHPLGSAVAGLAAFQAARLVFQHLFKGKAKVWKLGLMGIVAYNVIQKHRTGRNWLDAGSDLIDGMIQDDQLENPENRTLPNYWLRELDDVTWTPDFYDDLSRSRELTCLAIAGEMPITGVLDWYQQWSTWRVNPSNVSMPDIPEQYRMYRDRFGNNTSREQVGNYLYLTLHKFFVHRGRDVRDAQIDFDIPAGMSEDEGLGVAYIREKYLENKIYGQLTSNPEVNVTITMSDIDIYFVNAEGLLIDEEVLATDNPALYELYLQFLNTEESEKERFIANLRYYVRYTDTDFVETPVGDYPFDHILYLEMNPEAMLRRDAENADAASALASMWNSISSSDEPEVVVPDEEGEAEERTSGIQANPTTSDVDVLSDNASIAADTLETNSGADTNEVDIAADTLEANTSGLDDTSSAIGSVESGANLGADAEDLTSDTEAVPPVAGINGLEGFDTSDAEADLSTSDLEASEGEPEGSEII